MRRLAEINRDKLIDVLDERLAFERVSLRLYDAIIARVAHEEPAIRRMLPRLEDQRAEEREHASWLERQLVRLEADPTRQQRRARVAELETHGLEQVIVTADATVGEMMHALGIAELADEAGWRLLVELARDAGDLPAVEELEHRRAAEEAHVGFAQRALRELARNDVLGVPVTLPNSP